MYMLIKVCSLDKDEILKGILNNITVKLFRHDANMFFTVIFSSYNSVERPLSYSRFEYVVIPILNMRTEAPWD